MFFSCSQVGNIYLLQGEFPESICFLIPRSGAGPNFVYVDNLGVKWRKSDFRLLICTPGQNCKLDFHFSLSENWQIFRFSRSLITYISKHKFRAHHVLILSHLDLLQCIAHDSCETISRSSRLTFPTPAFVFNAVWESFTNLDAFDFHDLYRFMSKHKFSWPCAYLVTVPWYVIMHEVGAYKDRFKLHFRCFFADLNDDDIAELILTVEATVVFKDKGAKEVIKSV